jgi:preprotein translocase subunit SecD
MTTRSVGKPIAILLDKQIISAPNVNEAISGGRAQISGRFTVAEMRDLVIKLKAGALPVPIKIVSTKIVGPTLGKDSVEKSKKAGVIGFIFILVFMTALYQLPGLMASVALVAYVGMVLALLKIFHATLTLPGIAGLILTMGIAVDANVLIFSRIREERKAGLPSEAALEKGFARAFIAIVDSNVTTLIGALVLFAMGSGPIRGFAVSLGIGILVSMFTAITLTRMPLEGLSAIFPDKKGIIFKA